MHPYIATKRAKHMVLYYPPVSKTPRGGVEHGDPIEVWTFRVQKFTFLKSRRGEEIVSTTVLYADGILPISEDGYIQYYQEEEKRRVLGFEIYEGLREGTGTTVIYI